MDFKTHVAAAGGLAALATDALLVVIAGNGVPAGLDKPLADVLAAAATDGDFNFKAGQVLYAHRVGGVKAARVLFAAAGDGSAKGFRKALAAGLAGLKSSGAAKVAVALLGGSGLQPNHAEALVMVAGDVLYTYRQTKPSAPPAGKLASVSLVCAKDEAATLNAALRRGQAIASGVALARECANLPANHCTPTYLADEAKRQGKELGLKIEVLDRKACEKLGMGSFLSVAQGSAQAPKFIVMRYQGGARTAAPVVLVGKGITFDTGGISIKPSAGMDEMKFDMGGAASVLGTMRAAALAKAKVNLVGIIPSCENMPSSTAVKPGDVVTSMSGQTIEILNTDAEGRLILCDALTYAERFKPAAVIDIATLTGACVVALGHHRSGLFSPDDTLAAELLAAGELAADPAWRMPLDEEYDDALKSNFADMGNVGDRAAGAVTAAKFLQRFTGKMRWAHLDVAGTAWKSGAAKGARWRPVALLTHYLLALVR